MASISPAERDVEEGIAPWDGRRVPILIGVAMLDGEQGESVCFVLDISERKQMEEALDQVRASQILSAAARRAFADWHHEYNAPSQLPS